MGEHKTTRIVELECQHTQIFERPFPKLGEVLWCLRCRTEQTVIAAPDEWKIRCQGCIYNRAFGAAKVNAEISAAKHRLKQPSHIVRIYNGNKFVRQFPEKIADVLPGMGGDRYHAVTDMSSDSNQHVPF